jgi:transcriptional regulator with XRE-family HTH domain
MGQKNGDAFATRLRSLRLERGLSLKGLATRVGVSAPTLWHWESGDHKPKPNRLEAIAHALEVSEEYLVLGNPAPLPLIQEQLAKTVADARMRIARRAGVHPRNVRISIDL